MGSFASGNAKMGVLICAFVYTCMCLFDEPALGFGRVYYVRCGASTPHSVCLAWTPGWE